MCVSHPISLGGTGMSWVYDLFLVSDQKKLFFSNFTLNSKTALEFVLYTQISKFFIIPKPLKIHINDNFIFIKSLTQMPFNTSNTTLQFNAANYQHKPQLANVNKNPSNIVILDPSQQQTQQYTNTNMMHRIAGGQNLVIIPANPACNNSSVKNSNNIVFQPQSQQAQFFDMINQGVNSTTPFFILQSPHQLPQSPLPPITTLTSNSNFQQPKKMNGTAVLTKVMKNANDDSRVKPAEDSGIDLVAMTPHLVNALANAKENGLANEIVDTETSEAIQADKKKKGSIGSRPKILRKPYKKVIYFSLYFNIGF